MTRPAASSDHGVHATVDRLTESLRSYIEAQYHIRDESLIRERRKLLEEHGAVSQVPFVESTPVYELGKTYDSLALPEPAKDVLTQLAGLNVGLYPRPYVHQATSLEAFFARKTDLIVATGTGSGKTESFLMPIIGQLAVEVAERPGSAALPGVRALLLYPMNALVNDQLSRIRRLFGTKDASEIIRRGRALPVRFASYTGRTAYPGPRDSRRDTERIEPLFEEFYLPIVAEPEKEAELRAIGQLPEKDLAGFFGKQAEQMQTTRTGKQIRRRNWKNRLLTQVNDRELMTRHETQTRCPELLVTNYSMLEYMLMRPIERPIFQQTREWLQADSANELIIVLDEAHMYRGAGGAEVALLLRRLLSRLNVSRERVRFILTSASLGSSEEATRAITRFGYDLTGLADQSPRTFEVIRGAREERMGERQGTEQEAAALDAFDLEGFETYATNQAGARAVVAALSSRLGWPVLSADDDLADYLFANLTGFGPAERLIQLVAGKAMPLPELQNGLFGDNRHAEGATAALIAIATYARRKVDKRVLLPTRLHMFFRGLPALFACINSECQHVRERHSRPVLGRLHTHARERCQCGSRVYELSTHRECGTGFIKGYMSGPHGDFLWHQPSGLLREGQEAPLAEVELLVDGEPHRDRADRCISAWLDVKSGRVLHASPGNTDGFRRVFLPEDDNWSRSVRFPSCPVCRRTTLRSGRSTIMDHSTKGEAPFANLVKTQLDAQPAVREETRLFPNGGRKVLLFSDGRQKAARLARDIPREVEQDIFRQVLAVAAARLRHIGREPRPNVHLYIAVLTVLRDFNLPMFDRNDARQIENEIERLNRDHDGEDLAELLSDFAPSDTPARYKVALLKQLCGRYYSLSGTSVGIVLPIARAQEKLRRTLRAAVASLSDNDIDDLAAAWISELCDRFALDREIPAAIRSMAAGFWSADWGSDGKFERTLRTRLSRILGIAETDVPAIENHIMGELAWKHNNNAYFLDPSKVRIHIDLAAPWYQCRECTELAPFTIRGHCVSCASTELDTLDPQASEYIRARKSFWRDPVQQALGPQGKLRSISVEEHTAQLSNRDNTRVHATTEKFELRFRDIQIEPRDRPIDVLSCTTTMEVGVDIGSLVAVGLRNVPPQRENYQQRAGRAGRRGSSVSTVLTYAQNGPHDSYYYDNPKAIVAGPPRNPDIKIDNPKIARRHVASYLLQTFFHRYMDEHNITTGNQTSALFRALGKASDFFFGDENSGPSFGAFKLWVDQNVISAIGSNRAQIKSWLPSSLRVPGGDLDLWIGGVARDLIAALEIIKSEMRPPSTTAAAPQPDGNDDEGASVDDDRNALGDEELLEFLFSRGMLPSYAFPTDLTSFLVEKLVKQKNGSEWKMEIIERPQQGISKALSEYAPGRLIVINKETYRSGGVVANVLPTEHDRAAELFDEVAELVHCNTCSFVRDLKNEDATETECPVCSGTLERTRMIEPQVFLPEGGRALPEDDREQEITYATGAQFPVPVGTNDLPEMQPLGPRLAFAVTADRELVTANKGQIQDDASAGFWICEKCGRAETERPVGAPHERPYSIEYGFNQPKPSRLCSGAFHNVFLGHVFSTDLLLMRFTVAPPMAIDTNDPVVLRAIEDALYSISEALRLAASRHPQLDLDPSEFGSGFRIVPSNEDDQLFLDVYLYDTLSGGAGYAELAGKYLTEILKDVLHLLEHCPTSCDRSCESCLRHYHNQHLKDRLDRFIGAQLLRYALSGEIPPELTTSAQAQNLEGLARLLQLDGFRCTLVATVEGQTVPLLVERNGRRAVVGTQSGLLETDWDGHSLAALFTRGSTQGRVLNDFILRRNLPDEHQLIRSIFPSP
ncbi:DEAD/DEAH box helicase [Bradyrhizobium sp. CB3481]|uniref:DEAD/DEAH box helicase n=1 Tax=Bradyrhizobium sp. CB3481 TaxID=3039158 RepID=UPI0024B09441|nr:DEAD/DEAH box helicase [Bradyrhizobium sp. CB3481]WFU16460.1 DEAD/DEAH box helicase [Bradyrhizobium sp. CB3481]